MTPGKGQPAKNNMAVKVNKHNAANVTAVVVETRTDDDQQLKAGVLTTVAERAKNSTVDQAVADKRTGDQQVVLPAPLVRPDEPGGAAGVGPAKPRRGHPRKRGFSVDPVFKPGSDDMVTVLLGIREDNAALKTDILSNLDVKISQFKEGLAKELEPINEKVTQHQSAIEAVQKSCQKYSSDFRDIESRIHGIEDEISSVSQAALKDESAVVDIISSVETSLARDIESIRGHAEEKFDEVKQHHMLVEDRVHEMASMVEKENERFRIELEEVRATIEQLQQSGSETQSVSEGGARADVSTSSAWYWSGSSGSLRPENVATVRVRDEPFVENDRPVFEINTGRSITLSGIRENRWEKLNVDSARSCKRDRHPIETSRYRESV